MPPKPDSKHSKIPGFYAEQNFMLLRLVEQNDHLTLQKVLVNLGTLDYIVQTKNVNYPIINYAAKQKKWDIVHMLIMQGANINQAIRFSSGSSCHIIHLVVQSGDLYTLGLLLKRSDLDLNVTSQNHTNKSNETVFDIAAREKHFHVLEILRKYKHEHQDKATTTPPSSSASSSFIPSSSDLEAATVLVTLEKLRNKSKSHPVGVSFSSALSKVFSSSSQENLTGTATLSDTTCSSTSTPTNNNILQVEFFKPDSKPRQKRQLPLADKSSTKKIKPLILPSSTSSAASLQQETLNVTPVIFR